MEIYSLLQDPQFAFLYNSITKDIASGKISLEYANKFFNDNFGFSYNIMLKTTKTTNEIFNG
jgi:hypothetical protein